MIRFLILLFVFGLVGCGSEDEPKIEGFHFGSAKDDKSTFLIFFRNEMRRESADYEMYKTDRISKGEYGHMLWNQGYEANLILFFGEMSRIIEDSIERIYDSIPFPARVKKKDGARFT